MILEANLLATKKQKLDAKSLRAKAKLIWREMARSQRLDHHGFAVPQNETEEDLDYDQLVCVFYR